MDFRIKKDDLHPPESPSSLGYEVALTVGALRRTLRMLGGVVVGVVVVQVCAGMLLSYRLLGSVDHLQHEVLPAIAVGEQVREQLVLSELAATQLIAHHEPADRQSARSHLDRAAMLLTSGRGHGRMLEDSGISASLATSLVAYRQSLEASTSAPDSELRQVAHQAVLQAQALATQYSAAGSAASEHLSQHVRTTLLIAAILGLVMTALVTALVVTQQKIAGRQFPRIRDQEQRLRQIIDGSPTGIISAREDRIIEVFNPAAEHIFGWKAAEILGKPLDLLLPMDARERHRGHVQRFAVVGGNATDPLVHPRYVEAVRRDGQRFTAALSLSKIVLPSGVLLTAMARDATEELRLLEELREARDNALAASAAKSDFLATMSHEIRTPLNGVLGMLRLAFREPDLPTTVRERLRVAQASGDSMLQILNDVLDLGRVEAGQLTVDPIPVRLADEVTQVHALFAARAEESGLEYRLTGVQDLPPVVRLDPGRFRQVVANLLGNAVKFTAKGSVELQIRMEDRQGDLGTLVVEVHDTGIGMDDEALGRLFQPYQQAEAGTSRRFGGSGLGLFIVKRIVDHQQGTVSARSQPGQGSVFRITLPVEILPEDSAKPGSHASAALVAVRRGVVVVVDDDATNRLVAREFLVAAGQTVLEATSGAEALTYRSQGTVDLMLLDIHMPGLDGPQTLEALRNLERERDLPAVPVVALTASTQPEECRRWQQLGFSYVLTKPVVESDLVKLLAGLMPQVDCLAEDEMVLDEAHVHQLERRDLLQMVQEVFANSLEDRFRQLATGERVMETLHTFTGAAASIGLRAVARQCKELEVRIRAGRPLGPTDIEGLRRLCAEGLTRLSRRHTPT